MNNHSFFIHLILLFLAFRSLSAKAQQTAFEGAAGWAAHTPGGIGGEIVRVTNFDSDGTGLSKRL